jgi:predicted acylesterase/phospholipase RssA
MALHQYVPFLGAPMAKTSNPMTGASMTLVGLLPPLCDNGDMLVDGGYSKSANFV